MKPAQSGTSRPLALVTWLAMVAGCGSAPVSADDGQASTTEALVGHWESDCVGSGNGQAFRLTFDLAASTWALAYDAFADAACGTRNLTVNIDGPYTLGDPSKTVAGAREGNFGFTHKTVTPHSEGAAGFLSQACGGGTYAVGAPADITGGCPGLGAYPIAACATDHDLVAVVGETLQFGARPADNDMCRPEKRPVALGPALHRKK